MEQEVHLFILWEKAQDQQIRILKDMAEKFDILRADKLQWPADRFSQNLSRFYRAHLPEGCEKEKHCGTGAFLVVLVRDNAPVYEVRHTTAGDEQVNKNMFDAKSLYRQWTGGGHRIHGSNSTRESKKDIFLLLGVSAEQFASLPALEDPIGTAEKLSTQQRGLYAEEGFASLEEFFNALNATTDYVVMRNFEYLPGAYVSAEHGDIDLLCDGLDDLVYFAGATATHPKDPTRFQYTVPIGNEQVLFDFRCVGDGYYCEAWEKEILARKRQGEICIPSEQDYFYMLIYHAFIHKKFVSEEYLEKISKISSEIAPGRLSSANDEVGMLTQLDEYMKQNGYVFEKPVDASVVYHIYNTTRVAPSSTGFHMALEAREWKEVTDEVYDLLDQNAENLQSQVEKRDSWALHYYLDPARANLIRWYPFRENAKVLELNAGMGALTGLLTDRCAQVDAICFDTEEGTILSQRLAGVKNLKVTVSAPGQLSLTEKYDYIVAVGLLEYAPAFSSAEDPYADLIRRLQQALTKSGTLLLGAKNRFALPNWCGAADDITGHPFALIQNTRPQEWKCFTRRELHRLLQNNGLPVQRCFALYPNEIFTSEVFAEGQSACANQSAGSYPEGSSIVLREENLREALCQEGIEESFAGAFLLEAAATELSEQKIQFPVCMEPAQWLFHSAQEEKNLAEWQKNARNQAFDKEKALLEQEIRNKTGWVEQLLESERRLSAQLTQVEPAPSAQHDSVQLAYELENTKKQLALLEQRLAQKENALSLMEPPIETPENEQRTEEAGNSCGVVPEKSELATEIVRPNSQEEFVEMKPMMDIWQKLRAGCDPLQILAQDTRAIVYEQLTPEQTTLLAVMDLNPDMEVLQLSGGCGILTQALAKRVKRVEVQETNPIACRILRQVCSDSSNVQLYQAAAQDMRAASAYDAVLLIGALGKAKELFPDSSEPEQDLLHWAFGKLKPGGLLYVAVDNTLGARRMGSWDGTTPREKTFTRRTLAALLPKGENRWFYPLPDFHCPVEIVEESYLSQVNPRNTEAHLWAPTVLLHRENELLDQLTDIQDRADHLNSFLVEITKGEAE